MTFMYRLTLDCAHFMLHGPGKQAAQIFVGDPAVCQICFPIKNTIAEAASGKGDWVYPTRTIVNVEKVPDNLLPVELS